MGKTLVIIRGRQDSSRRPVPNFVTLVRSADCEADQPWRRGYSAQFRTGRFDLYQTRFGAAWM